MNCEPFYDHTNSCSHEYPCTTELGRSGQFPERTCGQISCWYIILVKPRSLNFALGFLHTGNSNACKLIKNDNNEA